MAISSVNKEEMRVTIAPGEDVPPSDEKDTGKFKIHYHLQGDAHFMDVIARNNAEREMLDLPRVVCFMWVANVQWLGCRSRSRASYAR